MNIRGKPSGELPEVAQHVFIGHKAKAGDPRPGVSQAVESSVQGLATGGGLLFLWLRPSRKGGSGVSKGGKPRDLMYGYVCICKREVSYKFELVSRDAWNPQ